MYLVILYFLQHTAQMAENFLALFLTFQTGVVLKPVASAEIVPIKMNEEMNQRVTPENVEG